MDLFNSYMALPTELRSIIHYMCYMLTKYDVICALTKCQKIGCENRRVPALHVCLHHKEREASHKSLTIMTGKSLGRTITIDNCFRINGYDAISHNLIPPQVMNSYINIFITAVRTVDSDDRTAFDLLKIFPGIEWYIRNLNEQKKIFDKERDMYYSI